MTINFLGKDIDLEYTFNSFKYMGDFDITSLNNLDKTPFKIFASAETLLLGALNSNRKVVYRSEQVQDYIEQVAIDGDLFEFVEKLVELLEESSFFKNLTMEKKEK